MCVCQLILNISDLLIFTWELQKNKKKKLKKENKRNLKSHIIVHLVTLYFTYKKKLKIF